MRFKVGLCWRGGPTSDENTKYEHDKYAASYVSMCLAGKPVGYDYQAPTIEVAESVRFT